MACSKSPSFSNKEIKDRIQNIWSKFVQGVDPDRLSDWLLQGNVITVEQWQKIRNENSTNQSRCRALLHFLFSIPHPRAFLVVYQALTEESHYILESIDNQEPASGTEFQQDIQDDTKLKQLEKNYEDQKRAWEAEKDRLLKEQKEFGTKLSLGHAKLQELEKNYEDQKRVWEAEKDRLLKVQNEFETRLHLDLKDKISYIQQKREEDKMTSAKVKDQLSSRTEQDRRLLDKLRKEYTAEPALVGSIKTKAAEEKKSWISGLALLNKELFVLHTNCNYVEVYDSMKFNFSRRWKLDELINPQDIGSCSSNKCLYIIDMKGSSWSVSSHEILRVDRDGKLIKSWSLGRDSACCLSVTYESNIIVTYYYSNKLIEYSPDGLEIQNINLFSAVGFVRDTRHGIKLVNGHFLICSSMDGDRDNRLLNAFCSDYSRGVCVVDANGKRKNSYKGRHRSKDVKITDAVYLSVDGNGFVMVLDRWNNRVCLLDSELEFKREIPLEKHGMQWPFRIFLDESNGRLFVAGGRDGDEKILIIDLW